MKRCSRTSRARSAIALLILASVAFGAASARAQSSSGIQVTPDGGRTLVSKDVGSERWAIARNPDGSVTGNVFFATGGAPKFVWCQETSNAGGQLGFRCSGSEACPLAPCEPDEWTFIADVTLPESFFSPASGASAATGAEIAAALLSSEPSATMAPMRRFLAPRFEATSGAGGGEDSPSGLQITPDGRTLISKDVGTERWAISRNDDGTITGNVFFPGGGEPKFVWCEQTGEADGNLTARCLGADPCARDGAGGCAGTGWTFIADVTLPVSFFEPREQVELEDVGETLLATFGDEGAFRAVALAVDRGYSLRQVLRASVTGRLRESGEIVEPSGAPEAPEGPPLGIFAGSVSQSTDRPQGSTNLGALIQAFSKTAQGRRFIVALLLELFDSGYSLDQIATAVLGAGAEIDFFNDGNKAVLVDENGDLIQPTNPGLNLLKRPQCQNGKKEFGEECDGAELGGATCESLDLPPGPLYCSQQCTLRTDLCILIGCGNGKIDGELEACDGSDLGGKTCESQNFAGGTLACGPTCQLDTQQCLACASGGFCCPQGQKACGDSCIDASAPCCGDGVREGAESCDGGDLGGETCAKQGQGSGILSCTDACTFDTGNCTGGGTCPNGTFACEGGCAPNGADCCTGESGYCSPGTVCVGDNSCCPSSHPKRCGNQCVPEGATCCEGLSCCGNGNIDGAEVCDGAELNGETCTSQGLPPGFLACSPACDSFDVSGCACDPGFKSCGDSCIPNANVCCSGNSCPAGTTCSPGGGCCGNGAREGGEVCDGSVGCDAGETCSSSCDSCVSTVQCGNGIVEAGEACDPPGSTSSCGGGEVCGADCSSCVSTISCEGRCCAGRNDACTPPGVACYCDQFCVENGDCCVDYGDSCG